MNAETLQSLADRCEQASAAEEYGLIREAWDLARVYTPFDGSFECEAATPALALCSAALKALAAQDAEHG